MLHAPTALPLGKNTMPTEKEVELAPEAVWKSYRREKFLVPAGI
jgi:hypothetical protein